MHGKIVQSDRTVQTGMDQRRFRSNFYRALMAEALRAFAVGNHDCELAEVKSLEKVKQRSNVLTSN